MGCGPAITDPFWRVLRVLRQTLRAIHDVVLVYLSCDCELIERDAIEQGICGLAQHATPCAPSLKTPVTLPFFRQLQVARVTINTFGKRVVAM